MTNERQRLPKNAAKVEFVPYGDTVKAMLNAGYNMMNIYNKLRDIHNISMSYFTFCALTRKLLKEEKGCEQRKPLVPPKIPSVSVAPKKFTRLEDIDRGSLF